MKRVGGTFPHVWRWAPWLILVLTALPAWGRVGGGQSYGGGGSSSRSGGSSGGGGGEGIGLLVELVFRILFYYPKIGIPLLIIGYFAYRAATRRSTAEVEFEKLQDWSAVNSVQRADPAMPTALTIESLKTVDPNFNRPLFLDFVSLVYTKTRTLGDLSPIGAYLSAEVRKRAAGDSSWSQVIVGGLRVVSVDISGANQRVVVQIEANLEPSAGTGLYVVEEMVLQRKPGVTTPAPEAVYKFSCPHCGDTAPVDTAGRCQSCGNQVNNGRFGWLVTNLERESSAPKPKLVLGSGGQELGTDLPTRRDPGLEEDLARLKATDPTFSAEDLQERARTSFLQLQQAWTEGRWEAARPLESDSLFGQHQIWMQTYLSEGLRNVLEQVEVREVALCRVERDAYYESVTFRIFARMLDYTVRLSDGDLVSGDPRVPRSFSEYWTFVRRAGVTTTARDLVTCPNCAAPLDRVNVAGVCEYCNANITRGDFDWVLSRIEQDEAYQ